MQLENSHSISAIHRNLTAQCKCLALPLVSRVELKNVVELLGCAVKGVYEDGLSDARVSVRKY